MRALRWLGEAALYVVVSVCVVLPWAIGVYGIWMAFHPVAW